MRRTFAYLAHPARLTAIGLLGALALTVLMLAGRPEAPPEAEAFATSASISLSSTVPSATPVTITVVLNVTSPITDIGFGGQLLVNGPFCPLSPPIPCPFFGLFPTTADSVSGPTPLTYTLNGNMNSATLKSIGDLASGTYTVVMSGFTNPSLEGTYNFSFESGDGFDFTGTTNLPVVIEVPAPSLTIEKIVNGPDALFDFMADGDANIAAFPLMNGGSLDLGIMLNGQMTTVTETVTAGYMLTSILCSGISGAGGAPDSQLLFTPGNMPVFTPGDTAVAVTVQDDDDIICTFINDEIPPAVINIVKNTIGGDDIFLVITDIPDNSNPGGTAPTAGGFQLMTSGGTAMETFTVAVPGSGTPFFVTEAPQPGWQLTNLGCAQDSGNPGSSISMGTALVMVAPGDEITCTFENTKTSSITIVKNTVPDGPQDFLFTLDGLSPTNLDDDADGTLPNSVTFNNLAPGLHKLVEIATSVPPNYTITDISCTSSGGSTFTYEGGSVPTFDAGDNEADVTLAVGDDVVCIFENTVRGAQLTIRKDAQPDIDDDFTFTPSAGINGGMPFDLDDPSDTGDATLSMFTFGPLTNGVTHTVQETGATPGLLSDFTTALQCSFDDAVSGSGDPIGQVVSFNASTRTLTFNPVAGESVTCTFINTPVGATLTIAKETIGGDATFNFASAGPVGNFSITTTGGSGMLTLIIDAAMLPATFSVTEGVLTGWDKTGVVCDNPLIGAQDGSDTATLNIDAIDVGDDVTCTFTNETAQLVIVKDATPDQDVFNFTVDAGSGSVASRSITGSGMQTVNLEPGSAYTVTEAVPASWNHLATSCVITNNESGGGSTAAGEDVGTGLIGELRLEAGDIVTCTFTNEKQATLTIQKVVVDGPAGTPFPLTQTGGGTDFNGQILKADPTPSIDGVVVLPGVYQFMEALPAASWSLLGIVCTGNSGAAATSNVDGSFDIEVLPGENVVCTLTNRKVPTLLITKTTALPGDFFFAIDEPDLVTNAEGFPILGSTGTLDATLGNGAAVGVAVANTIPVEIVELALTSVAPIISCTNLAGDDLFTAGRAVLTRNGAGVEVTPLNSEDITCEFNNDVGSVTIVKDTVPDQTRLFGFNVAGFAAGPFMLADGQMTKINGIPDGTAVTITEVLPFGFDLSSIACTGATLSTVAKNAAGTGVTVTIADGEDVVCTFKNLDTDADNDGLTDAFELALGTDPNNPDSDGDGVDDGVELLVNNTNPADPTNTIPVPLIPGVNDPLFAPLVSNQGATLTRYRGGRTVGQLLADLEERGATSATMTLPNGSTATLIVTQLTFVNDRFFDVFFDIDVGLDDPATFGVDSFFDLQIPLGTLMFVRSVN